MNEPALHEPSDAEPIEFGYGRGGVPWYLLCFYLAFLVFFAWYALEYQLPAFVAEGPGGKALAGAAAE